MLLERGIDLELMKTDQDMADVDDFDFICHVAFNKKPLTRKERANNVKKRDFSANTAVLQERYWKSFSTST